MMHVLAGALLGLAGSAHCLGMCGPLALVANRAARTSADRPRGLGRVGLTSAWLLHHAGRTAIYVLLGAIAGLTGQMVAWAGFQKALAIAAGVALILQATASILRLSTAGSAPLMAAVGRGLSFASRSLPAGRYARPFALGAINGLMPCGLVYAAAGAATGVGEVRAAIEFMSAFAVGTLPVFALLACSAHTLLPRASLLARRAIPAAIAIVGVLLIVRGMAGPDPMAHHAMVHARSLPR